VGTVNFGGYLLGTLAIPFVVARSRERVQLNTRCLCALSAALVGSATSLDLVQLGAWRLLIGLFSAPATVLTIALTLERVAPAERGRAAGMIWMGGAASVIVSGLVAPLVAGTGAAPAWRAAWVGMGLMGLVATWGLRRALRAIVPPIGEAGDEEAVPRTDLDVPGKTGRLVEAQRHGASARSAGQAGLRPTLTRLLHPRGLLALTLAYLAFGCGYIIYFTFFIALVVQQGVPALLVGLVWSALGLVGAAGGLLWGWAIDRWPSGFTLAVALALGALGALGVGGLALDGAGALLMGLCFLGTPTMVTVLLQRAVPAARYTASLSVLTAAFALGQMIGPSIGGVVADAHGLALGTATAAPLLASAALLAVGYGLVQRRQRRPT
jgi:predicted MFS family arabinose efflux permease